jgi:CRP/FNR family nitrogen fixation transcriptional regulator
MSVVNAYGQDLSTPHTRVCPSAQPLKAMESIATIISCRRGQEIHGPTNPVEHCYLALSGAAKEYTLLADGRQRIVDFLLPGDFFGFAARTEHEFMIEAIVDDTVLARYPRRELNALAENDPQFAQLIREIALETISRSRTQILTLGRVNGPQKVGAFLLEMAQRSSNGGDAFDLPVSRYDMADYLGLTVETVSRALTRLRSRGAIRIDNGRRITIVDYEALDEG